VIPLHEALIPAVSKSSPKTTPQKPRFYGVFCYSKNRTRNLRFLVQKCLVPFRLPPTISLMKDKRVAIYVRVSTQDQNLDQQEEELNRYCEVRNWSNVTIYRAGRAFLHDGGQSRQQHGFAVLWRSCEGSDCGTIDGGGVLVRT